MKLDLNDSNSLTMGSVRNLIASASGDTHTQLRVNTSGIAYLSKVVGNIDTEDLAFRLETWLAGNGYVGAKAAADEKWISRILNCLRKNWPTPSSSYIDIF